MRAYRAKTLTALHHQLCDRLVHSGKEELDVITSVDVQIHNTVSEALSMEWDFDMKDMWLTKSRWSMMARQYVDPNELRIWIEKCTGRIGLKGRGIAMMRTKLVAARGGPAQGNKESRRWGSCMMGLSYKALPAPQITLYSRTSYLGYLGALDLTVAWTCARYLAKELGVEVESLRFVWFNEALQYHNFKSLAFLLNHNEEPKREMYREFLMARVLPEELEDMATPALTLSRRWLQKLMREDDEGQTLGDMSYNTYRRIRRRFHTEVMGYEYAKQFEGWSHHKKGPSQGERKEFYKAYTELPSVLASTLDFSPIGMPLTGGYGIDYDEGVEDDDDEE